MQLVPGRLMRRPEGKLLMAEKRKFAALADLHRKQPEAETSGSGLESEPPVTVAQVGRGRGRPATGKRSNPDWKLYSHFLKRRTQREAVARLQAEDDSRDLSDVLQELLENWLKS
jgi:hypothetical protein